MRSILCKLFYVLMMLCCISSAFAAAPQVVKKTLETRMLQMNEGGIHIAIFQIHFDQPIFLNSTEFPTLQPLTNFNSMDQQIEMPNIVSKVGGTAKYKCANEEIHSFIQPQQQQNNNNNNQQQQQGGPPQNGIVTQSTVEPAVTLLNALAGIISNDTVFDNAYTMIVIMGGMNINREHDPGNMINCPPQIVFPDDIHNTYNPTPKRIVNAANEPFLGTVTFTEFYQRKCDSEQLGSFLEKYNQVVTSMKSVDGKEALQNIDFRLAGLSASAIWSTCNQQINQFFNYAPSVVLMDNVRGCFEQPNTAKFATNPCCNMTLQQTQCCVPQNGIAHQIFKPTSFNGFSLNRCIHPDGIKYILENYAQSSQDIERDEMLSNMKSHGGNDMFSKYNEFLQECQALVFQTECKVDSDCKYSQRCDDNTGNCAVDWNNQNDHLLQCYFDEMPTDLMFELSSAWNVPYYSDATQQRAAFWPKFQEKTLDYDCVGQRSERYRARDVPPQGGGNGRWTHIAANETGCLLEKGCNWNAWTNTNEQKCVGDSVLEVQGTHLCGLFDGMQYQQFSEKPQCRFANANSRSACENTYGGVWVQSEFYSYCWDKNNTNAWQDCMTGPLCSNVGNVIDNLAPGQMWVFEPRCQTDACYAQITPQQCFQRQQSLQQSGNSNAQQFAQNLWWWHELQVCVRMASWGETMTASTCSAYNMTYHAGKQYILGKWHNETECDRGVCSVNYLRNAPVSAERCEQVPLCSQPCKRCVPSLRDESGQDKTLCFSHNITSMDDCQTNNGKWEQGLSKCFFPALSTRQLCTAASHEFYSCDEAGDTMQQCNLAQHTYQEAHPDAQWNPAFHLHCQWDNWASCRSEEECTSNGRCNDFDLQNWEPGTFQPTESLCIHPWEYDQYGNRQHCQSFDESGVQTNIRWTQLGCGYTQFKNESTCVAAGHQWYTQAKNQSACESHGVACFGAKRMGGNKNEFNKMNSGDCSSCEGDYRSIYKWQSGVPIPSEILPLHWIERKWESINQYKLVISWQKMNEAIQTAVSQILIREKLNTLSQKYNRLIPLMQIIACDCFETDPDENADCFSEISDTVVDVTCRVDPDQINVCGSITVNNTILDTSKNVSSQNTEIVRTLAGPFLLKFSTNTNTNTNGTSRRLLAANSVQYDIVENSNGVVVGQLIGDGIYYNQEISELASELCLSKSLVIDIVNSDFVVYDFVVSVDNSTLSEPMQLNLTLEGLDLCHEVSTSGMYFPISRVLDVGNYTGPSSTSSGSSSSLSNNAIIGMVVGIVCGVIALGVLYYYYNCTNKVPAARRFSRRRTTV